MTRWPDFFIVGAEKSGTTSLHRYLREHPDVFMSRKKEPGFFNKALDEAGGDKAAEERATAAYLEHFRGADGHAAVGESTTAYLWHPEAPRRIAERVPGARALAVLRDPVERAYSHYRMVVRLGGEDRPFREAAEAEVAAVRAGRRGHRYVLAGLYHQQLSRYVDALGRHRVRALLFSDLKTDPHGVLRDAADFLGVDPAPLDAVDTATRHNVAKAPRSRLARFLRHDPRVQRAARLVVPERAREFLGERVLYRPVKKPPMDPEAARYLWDAVYDEEMARLEELLGRALPELRRSRPPDA